MKTFFWDFWGPHAERTARHFEHHLKEFLQTHKCESSLTEVLIEEGHASVSCSPPEEAEELIMKVLRPRRSLDSTQV